MGLNSPVEEGYPAISAANSNIIMTLKAVDHNLFSYGGDRWKRTDVQLPYDSMTLLNSFKNTDGDQLVTVKNSNPNRLKN